MGVIPASATPSGRRHKARRRHMPMAEINVTPFVDVMLVLLIVFMVTAPLLTTGVPVDLPNAKAEALNAETEPLNVTVRAGGQIFLQEAEITADELTQKVKAIVAAEPEKRIIISGDKNADYGTVAAVFARLKEAGTARVLLQTKALGETGS
jgi:biopolymer transport protein TolR